MDARGPENVKISRLILKAALLNRSRASSVSSIDDLAHSETRMPCCVTGLIMPSQRSGHCKPILLKSDSRWVVGGRRDTTSRVFRILRQNRATQVAPSLLASTSRGGATLTLSNPSFPSHQRPPLSHPRTKSPTPSTTMKLNTSRPKLTMNLNELIRAVHKRSTSPHSRRVPTQRWIGLQS